LLRATGLAAVADALVRVKYHYPEVDMAKIKEGADTTKNLQALDLEVDEAANEVWRTSTSKAMVEPATMVATMETSSS
jgi:hypothetical protein